jgi:hypothetical protein
MARPTQSYATQLLANRSRPSVRHAGSGVPGVLEPPAASGVCPTRSTAVSGGSRWDSRKRYRVAEPSWPLVQGTRRRIVLPGRQLSTKIVKTTACLLNTRSFFL